MDRWKSKGGKSQGGEEKKWEDQKEREEREPAGQMRDEKLHAQYTTTTSTTTSALRYTILH